MLILFNLKVGTAFATCVLKGEIKMSKTLTTTTNNNRLHPFFYNDPILDLMGSSMTSFPVFKKTNNYLSKKTIETNCHYDIIETDSEILLKLYIPKEDSLINKENASIEFENSLLKINIEISKNGNEENIKSKTNIPEKIFFNYQINDSEYEIDTNSVSARLDKNILFVTMLKKNLLKRIMIE